jgi:hypothetical protein
MPLLALALASYLDGRLPSSSAVGSLLLHHSQLAFGVTIFVLVAAVGSCVFAAHQHLIGLVAAGAWGLVSLSALIVLVWRRWKSQFVCSWLLCGATTFAVLLIGIYAILPGYTRRFSMRGQIRPLAVERIDASLPVACYPRGWDSVSFYLQREGVQVYKADERERLLADLAGARLTLLFVKTSRTVPDLIRDLPEDLEFVVQGRQGTIRVGLVRPRSDRQMAARDEHTLRPTAP